MQKKFVNFFNHGPTTQVNTVINKRHKLDEELNAVQDELYAIFQDIEHNMRDYDLLAKIKTPDVVDGVDTEKSGGLKRRY